MKQKKKLYNAIAFLVFAMVITVPFIDLNRRNNIESEFNEIQRRIYLYDSDGPGNYEKLFTFCDSINDFIASHPIQSANLNCDSIMKQEPESGKNDFIKNVQNIDTIYRRQARNASHRFFIILIISQILLTISRRQIDKRFR